MATKKQLLCRVTRFQPVLYKAKRYHRAVEFLAERKDAKSMEKAQMVEIIDEVELEGEPRNDNADSTERDRREENARQNGLRAEEQADAEVKNAAERRVQTAEERTQAVLEDVEASGIERERKMAVREAELRAQGEDGSRANRHVLTSVSGPQANNRISEPTIHPAHQANADAHAAK